MSSGLVDFVNFTVHITPGIVLAYLATLWYFKWQYQHLLVRESSGSPLEKEIELWRKTANRMGLQLTNEEREVKERIMEYVDTLERHLVEERLRVAQVENGNYQPIISDGGGETKSGELQLLEKQQHLRQQIETARKAVPGNHQKKHGHKKAHEDEEDDEDESEVDIAHLELKYQIKDRVLFVKSCIVILFVISMFFLHPFVSTIHLSLPWVALIGAMLMLAVSGIDDLDEVLKAVEMPTLLFFAGLFVLMKCMEEMGVMLYIAHQTADIISIVPEVRYIFL